MVKLDQNSAPNNLNQTWLNWIKIQHQIFKITHGQIGSKFNTKFSKLHKVKLDQNSAQNFQNSAHG